MPLDGTTVTNVLCVADTSKWYLVATSENHDISSFTDIANVLSDVGLWVVTEYSTVCGRVCTGTAGDNYDFNNFNTTFGLCDTCTWVVKEMTSVVGSLPDECCDPTKLLRLTDGGTEVGCGPVKKGKRKHDGSHRSNDGTVSGTSCGSVDDGASALGDACATGPDGSS